MIRIRIRIQTKCNGSGTLVPGNRHIMLCFELVSKKTRTRRNVSGYIVILYCLFWQHSMYSTVNAQNYQYAGPLDEENYVPVFRIRIHWIHMILGLPDPDPSIILLSSSKNSKKNPDSYCFVTSFELFIFVK
jgi:hypothetical protein